MAGADGTQAEDRKLDGYFGCGAIRGHVAVTNNARPELMGPKLRKDNSRRILVVVH